MKSQELSRFEIRKLLRFTGKIEGWLSPQEGVFLYKLASRLPAESNIVEIGSWKGKSSVWLGSALKEKERSKVYAVDPHIGSPEKEREYGKTDTFAEFQKNIKAVGLSKKVMAVKKTSGEAAPDFQKEIDLLFIDASHAYEAVEEDFVLWFPKLKKGGWVVFHDATVLPGPWRVASRNILFSSQFRRTGMLGSMVFGQYVPTDNYLSGIANLFLNVRTYLFTMSYVTMRKVPFPVSWRRKVSRVYFRNKIKLN